MQTEGKKRPQVVIVGGGFGGLATALALANSDVDVLLIDKTNHHVFQPLLYQVATAGLSPGDIAAPLRSIVSKYPNIDVAMDEVESIDTKASTIVMRNEGVHRYDWLVVATGARHSYFGRDHWEEYAPGIKSLDDALRLRERTLRSFETAENLVQSAKQSHGDEAIRPWLTFVIVGAGPTGVEIAGALAEIAAHTIKPDFPMLRNHPTEILLVEGGPRVLPGFSEELSARALRDLQDLGVRVILNASVSDIDAGGATVGGTYIPSKNVIWSAGNKASALLEHLRVPLDRQGRAFVGRDLSIPDSGGNVFVIGDAAHFDTGKGPLPGVAQVAMQMGRHVAGSIKADLAGATRKPFTYKDKGSMATIGKARAVAQLPGLSLGGLPAWLLWAVIHVAFLITFRNRFRVMTEWIWYYLTHNPGARLITRTAVHEPQE